MSDGQLCAVNGRKWFFVGRAVRATPRRPWLGKPADTVSLRCPAPLTDRPPLPLAALATMLLAHVQSFGRFDEITYLVAGTGESEA
jgi:hypothetical protein